jgi:hypothetical protein
MGSLMFKPIRPLSNIVPDDELEIMLRYGQHSIIVNTFRNRSPIGAIFGLIMYDEFFNYELDMMQGNTVCFHSPRRIPG